jgi:hypothetical protein
LTPRQRGAALLNAVRQHRFNPQAFRKGIVPAAAGGYVLAGTPLAGALFAFPPVAGAVALAGWAAARARQGRVGPRDVTRDVGRAPTADEMAGVPDDGVGAAYGRHVEAVAAAGNGADPVGSAHHPDVRSPTVIYRPDVAGDGSVYGATRSHRRVPLTTPGWNARDGEAFVRPRGYRNDPPVGEPPALSGPPRRGRIERTQ